MISKSNSTFNEVHNSLNKVYKYINNDKTEELGKDLFEKLIIKNISQKTLIFSIINDLEEKISQTLLLEIDPYPYIQLLSLFFINNDSNNISLKIYYPYINPILSIIQSLINDKNTKILEKIPIIFMEIVQNLMPSEISASTKKLNEEEKKVYEIIQNFCFINLKLEQNINHIIGSLCLTKLVENCPFVLKNEYLQVIANSIITELTNDNFLAKNDLLNCLISLILGAEKLFIPYTKSVLNIIINILATEEDPIQKKLSLNIIYTMIFYCEEEILPLKEKIIKYLNILKNDKSKEIKDISLLILKILKNNNNFNDDNDNNDKDKDNNDIRDNNDKDKDNSDIRDNKSAIKQNNNMKRKSHLSSSNINKKSGKINYKKYNNNNYNNNNINIEILSPKKVPKNNLKNLTSIKRSNSLKKRTSNFSELSYKINGSNNKKIIKRPQPTLSLCISKDNYKNKYNVNRTKNFAFINEKMKIKTDPQKSIFNTCKNKAFFENNSDNKNQGIIIISSKNDKNNATNNEIIKKNLNNIEPFYKNEVQEEEVKNNNYSENKINENIKKIENDYDNNIDKINKLILLDAKIKSEQIKKIDNDLENFISNEKTKSFKPYIEKNNIKNTNDCNQELIKALLSEVRELSNKQISLLDLMDDIQTNTQKQIDVLNIKINDLNNTVQVLDQELYNLQNVH